MTDVRDIDGGPRVSVVLLAEEPDASTAAALRSALGQSYRNLEVLVAGAGAHELARHAGGGDPPVRPMPGEGSRAAAVDRAARAAAGQYVAYLDGRSAWHRGHVRTLVDALEASYDCEAAYSDVYRTLYRPTAGGGREVLGKVVHCRRDFDRFFLLHRDYIPLPSLLHRRGVLDRTGPLAEGTGRRLAWDLCRRLACFTDLLHVPAVTAETYVPDHDADPGDGLDGEAIRRVLAAEPPRPWPKLPALSVLLAPEGDGDELGTRAERLCRRLRVPCRLYLAAPRADAVGAAGRLVPVSVRPSWPWDARIDKAVRACDGDCVAILPPRGRTTAAQLTAAYHALLYHALPDEAVLPAPPRRGAWGVVVRRRQLLRARNAWPALPIRRALEADGLRMRLPRAEELPFAFDRALAAARAQEAEGNFRQAAQRYDALAREHGHDALLAEAAARSLFREGRCDDRALERCRRVNADRPTVAALLLEARLLKRNQRTEDALRLLACAKQLLDWQPERDRPSC